jgi:hypothetical protein
LDAKIVVLDPRTCVRTPRGAIYMPATDVEAPAEAAPWARQAFASFAKLRGAITATISPRVLAAISPRARLVGVAALSATALALVAINHVWTSPAANDASSLGAAYQKGGQYIPFASRWWQAETEIANQITERGETPGPLTRLVRTVSFTRPTAAVDPSEHADSSENPVTFSLASIGSRAINIAKDAAAISSPRVPGFDEVEQYLWEVYKREPVKKDGSGDFTWKDPAAAKRMNMPLPKYVISGMDPDFREQLYHAGRAMDADGLKWSMLSAFRDDYRQSIASGLKASSRNSRHGGSVRTGGYGHGQAVDITGTDGTRMEEVWRWIDAHGAKYGLRRPMPGYDPAHVEGRGDWRRVAQNLRKQRTELARQREREEAKLKLASATEK